MDNTFKRLELMLGTLSVFRELQDTPVISQFRTLLREAAAGNLQEAAAGYAGVFSQLSRAGFTDIGTYLYDLVKYTETPLAKKLVQGTAEPIYVAAAERDIGILSALSSLSCGDIKRGLLCQPDGAFDDIIHALPEWETDGMPRFDELQTFYRLNGTGILARHHAFIWSDNALVPVKAPDTIRYEQMVGYNWQRQAVLENTRALVEGRTVNNVLLYGDSGTGKSATVKSMLNVVEFNALTLIEVKKQYLSGLPALMDELAWRPRKFILFIDDLTFEAGDPDYAALKVILEGSLGQRPMNVVLYVTSNRRQLVKRYFSDRDEMNETESVQEKTSLSDRFGLRIPFFSLNQEEYLFTAEVLVKQAGVELDSAALKQAALQWEIEHGSRTPRTARQFADETAAKYMK